MKQLWDFIDKKGLQPWSDLLKFKADISLKERLNSSDTKALHLGSEFLQIQAKKSLKKWLDFSDKKGLQLWLDLLRIVKNIETMVGFFR